MSLKLLKNPPRQDYKPLVQSYLIGEYSLQTWRVIISQTLEIIESQRRFQLHDPVDKVNSHLKANFLDNPRSSANRLLSEEPTKRIFSQTVVVNDLECKPLPFYLDWLDRVFDKHIASSISHLTQVHGNLQLSNLEWDQSLEQIRIRPGSSTKRSKPLFGDFRLDLAKLSLGLVDYVDLIAIEHFFLLCSDNQISLDIKRSEKQFEISQIFLKEIGKRYCNEGPALRIGQAIELVRMAELYENQMNRQLALLTLAVMHLERLYKEFN